MSDAPDFQKAVVLNSTPSFVMPTADSPDWQETVQLVNSPHSDAPDWQQYIVGPGGVPIVTTPTRQTITRIADWSDSGTAATGTTLSLVISPVNLGDLLVCSAAVFESHLVIGMSGGGVTDWTLVTSGSEANTAETVYQWQGVVTATGSQTITVTVDHACDWFLQATELNTPTPATWYVYGSTWKGCYSTSTYGYTTPALTPQGKAEMYLAWVAMGTPNMSMPGFVFGGGTLVEITGTYANYAGVATMPDVAYPTNYEYIVNGTGNTSYDEIGCLIYATI